MQPASDSNGSGGRDPMKLDVKRILPIVVIGIVIGIVLVAILTSGDDDGDTTSGDTTSSQPDDDGAADDPADDPSDGPATDGRARSEGAISFSQAQAEGLDVTFPDTCDLETGRVTMPYYFAAECYANVDDNGGATSAGVTADEIVVVVYIPPDVDLVFDYFTRPIANDDTGDQAMATYQGYTDMYHALYQTYGRRVVLKELRGSSNAADAVAARADAVKAHEELGAFAVWGGPALSNAWTDELAARGVLCFGCASGSQEWIEARAPYVYAITAQGYQTHTHLAEYLSKKLVGQPAVHAGDDAFHATERVFGDVYLRSSEESDTSAAQLADRLDDAGAPLREQLPFDLSDPSRLPEQATNIIAKLKDAGVTSVIYRGDPVTPGILTAEATSQDYFPEWILGGSALVDATAFGRTFDQQQWAHAFGISSLTVRTDPNVDGLYEWFHDGEHPPARDTDGVIFPQPALFFTALQAAGPDLTPESIRDGLFSVQPQPPGAVTNQYITYGNRGIWPLVDYNGIDDFTEIWWDPDATGPDEIRKDGQGMYQYVDGGKRYLPEEWTDELAVFDPSRSVALLDEVPAAEQTQDYDPPSG